MVHHLLLLAHRQLRIDGQLGRHPLQVFVQAHRVRRQAHRFHLVQRVSELHLHFVNGSRVFFESFGKIEVVDVLGVETLDPFGDD